VPVDLATRTWGSGDRRALLIHGLSSNSDGWWRLGPDLGALGFTVTAPDLRGHGKSDDGDGFHLEGYRDDVLAMGGDWDLVLGHSLGGLVALACQLADPGFAGRLVLEDPAIGLQVTPEVIGWLLTDYEPPITVEKVAAKRPRWDVRDVEAKVKALRDAGEHVVAPTATTLAVDLWDEMADVTVPVLLVCGDPDLDSTVSAAVGANAAHAANVEYVVVAGASHSVHRDSYDAFSTELRTWLAAHDADT
jgi:pimeloyl-ACP methyl ester carboxylesterase